MLIYILEFNSLRNLQAPRIARVPDARSRLIASSATASRYNEKMSERRRLAYDSEELESPVETMASFAANSPRRLRGAVVLLIRERTLARTSAEPPQHRDGRLSSTTIRFAQYLDRVPSGE